MRFTHSSLLTLTTVISSSLLFNGASTAPISPSDVAASSSVSEENPIVAFDHLASNYHTFEKRCGHKDKHVKAAAQKKHGKKRHTTTKKVSALSKKKKKSSSKKKSLTKKSTTKKKSSSHKKLTTHKKKKTTPKKKTTKKKTTKKKTTKKKTTKKKTTKKKTTKKKTTKKASSSSGNSGTFTGDGTYYNPGLGSCGIENSDHDLIAALNAPQMQNGANPNNNPNCGKYINVKGPNGSVKVKIVDTCPPCVKGDVDLSPAAFGKIADFADGRVKISWSWA